MAELTDKTPYVNISVGSLCPDPVSYALKYFSNHGRLTHQQGTVGKVNLGYVEGMLEVLLILGADCWSDGRTVPKIK